MANENDLNELNSNFKTNDNCAVKIATLLFIPTVIYLVVILSYFKIIPLKMEIHSVILMGLIYLIYLFFVKHNAYNASCKFKGEFNQLKESLLSYINKNKVIINETTKANGSIEDFLTEFTRDLRNINFSSVAAGIFPTLGILGTFISIAVTMPDFSSKTSAVLEQEISILLGGVGTAFYVSIYGIFLSIWWIFFEKIGISRFEHDANIIKESTKSLFWNKIEIEKIQFQKSMENFEKLNSVFTQMTHTDIERSLNQSLEKKSQLFDKLIEQESDILEKSKEFLQNTQQKHQQIIASYDNVIYQLGELTPILNEALKNTTLISKHFNRQEKNLEDVTNRLNSNIVSLKQALSNINAQKLTEVSDNLLKNLEVMKNDTDRIGWRLNQQLNDFDSDLNGKLVNSLELIDKETASIVEQLKPLKG
jgi:hypothetical protein